WRSRCVRVAVGAVLGMLASACSTQQALREVVPGSDRTSSLGGAMATFERLPYASMLLRIGNRFQALLLLGHVGADGVQTWYGADGLAVRLRDGRQIYSRGLPVDIFESHVAGTPNDEVVDCGDGSSVTVRERLHYARLREQQSYFTELSESVRCTR